MSANMLYFIAHPKYVTYVFGFDNSHNCSPYNTQFVLHAKIHTWLTKDCNSFFILFKSRIRLTVVQLCPICLNERVVNDYDYWLL